MDFRACSHSLNGVQYGLLSHRQWATLIFGVMGIITWRTARCS
jgi:hypothetical protein